MLLGLTLNAFGQSIGISATYNMAKFKHIYDGEVMPDEDFIHYNSLSSFGFTFNYDMELKENLFGEFGISYVQKGLKEVVEGEGYEGNDNLYENFKISYLQFPLYIRYNFPAGDNMRFFGFGGLDIGMALGGKYIRDDGHDKEETDLKFGSAASNHFKSMDMGFTLGGGMLYNNFELRLGYNMGMSNISTDSDEVIKNRVFFIGFGYRFNL